jgi:hypothetical protein
MGHLYKWEGEKAREAAFRVPEMRSRVLAAMTTFEEFLNTRLEHNVDLYFLTDDELPWLKTYCALMVTTAGAEIERRGARRAGEAVRRMRNDK